MQFIQGAQLLADLCRCKADIGILLNFGVLADSQRPKAGGERECIFEQ
jgi:hypothetical protein